MNKSILHFYNLEWQRWKRDLLFQLAVLCIIPLLLVTLFMIDSSVLFNFSSFILAFPKEVYALLGIPNGTYGRHFVFFIFYAMLVLNIWFAHKKCTQAVQSLRWDERAGSVYLWVNQMTGRKQFVLLKYFGTLVSFWSVYFFWHAVLYLMVHIGAYEFQRQSYIGVIFKLFLFGGSVITMLITIAYFYAVLKESDGGDLDTSCARYLITGTLITGNLYKVRDLIIWIIELFNENTSLSFNPQGLINISLWLNDLYWVSPLSWLNPYVFHRDGAISLLYFVSIFLTVIFGTLMIFIYQRRRL